MATGRVLIRLRRQLICQIPMETMSSWSKREMLSAAFGMQELFCTRRWIERCRPRFVTARQGERLISEGDVVKLIGQNDEYSVDLTVRVPDSERGFRCVV